MADFGIAVNILDPGWNLTKPNDDYDDEVYKRMRLPDDIAEVAVYMAQQTPETMTGQLVAAPEYDEEHGIERLSAYERLHASLPSGGPYHGRPSFRTLLVVQVDGGDDPRDVTHNAGGVSAAGQIFGEVDVSWTKPVYGAIAEADFRLAGEGDQVLPAGSHVPIAEESRRQGPENDSLGVVQLRPSRMGGRVYHFDV